MPSSVWDLNIDSVHFLFKCITSWVGWYLEIYYVEWTVWVRNLTWLWEWLFDIDAEYDRRKSGVFSSKIPFLLQNNERFLLDFYYPAISYEFNDVLVLCESVQQLLLFLLFWSLSLQLNCMVVFFSPVRTALQNFIVGNVLWYTYLLYNALKEGDIVQRIKKFFIKPFWISFCYYPSIFLL